MARMFALLAVASFAIAVTSGTDAVLSSGSTEEGVCPKDPCAGFLYQVLYDEDTGKVRGIHSWDPTVSDLMELGAGIIPRAGQKTAIISGDSIAGDTFQDAATDEYRFDASSSRIERVNGDSSSVEEEPFDWLTSAVGSSSAIPVLSLTVGLVLSAASFITRRRTPFR